MKPAPQPQQGLKDQRAFRLGFGIGSAIAAIVATTLLLGVPLEKEIYYEFVRDTTPLDVEVPIENEQYTRTTVYFYSHGTRCEAWLYEPRKPEHDRSA